MQPSSTDDDEALARMLQYEEQTANSRSGGYHHNDEQEQRDSELARAMAQLEFQQGDSPATVVGYGATTRPTSNVMRESMRSHSLDRQDSFRRYSHPARNLNVDESNRNHSSMVDEAIRFTHSRSFSDYDTPSMQFAAAAVAVGDSAGGHDPDLAALGDLEYARRLQEAAWHRLQGTGGESQPGVVQISTTAEERADMELARRMQEMENTGLGGQYSGGRQFDQFDVEPRSTGSGGAAIRDYHRPLGCHDTDEDERIARLMAATGKSLRDLLSSENDTADSSPTRPPLRGAPEIPPPSQSHQQTAQGRHPPIHADSVPGALSVAVTTAARQPHANSAPGSPRGGSQAVTIPSGIEEPDAFFDVPTRAEQKKKKSRKFLGFRSRGQHQQQQSDKRPPPGPGGAAGPKPAPILPVGGPSTQATGPSQLSVGTGGGMIPLSIDSITGIPAAIPPPPGGSLSAGGRTPAPQRTQAPQSTTSSSVCFSCGKSQGSFIAALDKKYHPECFRCVVCHELINVNKPFAFSKDAQGYKHPHHPRCFSQRFASTCCVCKQKLPANEDGTISFVKHPFFDTEEMCPRHALEAKRRCTGCHRFEPDYERFIDLDDGDRCICFSCCRSVVVDSNDAAPLWSQVIAFFKNKLHLPIWDGMKDIPIMIVGFEALNDQLQRGQNAHGGSSQIMTRGLCLTDHANCGTFRLPSMRFNTSQSSFEATNGMDRFTYYEVPASLRANANSTVFAIMCLSGLPRDLTASVLAHEATHAWIKMHPEFDVNKPIPPQVEEGVAQLVAFLFLNDGLDEAAEAIPGESGPSDAKLRQYFRFSIETEENEVYGTGYRRAAAAYEALGIEALLMHVIRYRDFPHT
uniref:LIM zinc-binding domain-containing protein n=1 Tax=Amphora coffeiformis TaxID=265554 RepID=A0A7S3KXY2_9STRA